MGIFRKKNRESSVAELLNTLCYGGRQSKNERLLPNSRVINTKNIMCF